MATTTDPSTQTPVEIDTVLAANYGEQLKLESRIGSELKHLDYLKRLRQPELEQVEKTSARITKYQKQLHDLITESAPLQVEYFRRSWNRYFLVTNGNGHVHRGMNCSTCFPTTQYAWLVDLADCDENAMIEEWGERACTVCFPSAPVNPNYHRPARIDREAQEARAAEKAAREAAKSAKALVEPVRIPSGGRFTDLIETVAAAKQGIRDNITNTIYYGHEDYYDEAIRILTDALLHKGIEQSEIDTIKTRAEKKARKESGS